MIIHNIQQGSPEWFELRVGKITGGSLGRVVKSEWLTYVDQIVSERLTGCSDNDDTFESFDMIRGKDLEPLARAEYIRLTSNELNVYGFVQPDNMPYFGFSPDGITPDGSGAIEIKSPRAKKHCTYIRQDKFPTEHLAQGLSAFICSDQIQWVDFISYCPELEVCPIWIKRMTRDEMMPEIDKYIAGLIKFEQAAQDAINQIKSINQPEF
jgi:hypothetical protein